MQLSKHKVLVHLLLGFVVCLPAFVHAAENGSQDPNAASETHFGYPQDWSSRHIVLTGDDDSATLKAGFTEPRHVYNMVMRRAAIEAAKRRRRKPRKNAMKVDWAVSLRTDSFLRISLQPNTGLTSPNKVATTISCCSA